MARYIVMQPSAGGHVDHDRTLILRDGFHLLAFFAPPLWLIWNRLWIEAAVVVAVMLGLGVLREVESFGWTGSALSLLLSFYIGLEGASLWIAAFRRRGWIETMAIEADSLEDAEIRYAGGVGDDVEPMVDPPWQTSSAGRRSKGRSALGLLSYPGRP